MKEVPMFQASLDPVAGNLALSAAVACVPLVAFFVLLAVCKLKAHVSAAIALAISFLVAVFAFGMPAPLAALSATQGAAYGAFPIVFIIILAVWFYEVTVLSGRFADLRRFFDIVGGGDVRIQAVLIAFCFGGLLEALAGFGAPIAITATMVLALGIRPLRAALAVLIANTAPVAYGAVATPITMAGNMVSGGDAAVASATSQHVAAIVGVQAPLFAAVVPLLVCAVLDGKHGVRDCWPPALVCGMSFAVVQWWCSNNFAYELTDVMATLASLGITIAFMRVWKPRGVEQSRARFGLPESSAADDAQLTPVRAWMALLPYAVVIAVFAVGKLAIPGVLSGFDIKIPWPGLAGNVLTAVGANPGTTYTLPLLSNPGSMLLVAGIIVAAIYAVFNGGGEFKMGMGQAARALVDTAWKMRTSCLTIVLVLALAYVMNFSGMTMCIGELLAETGVLFALLSPVLGWVGTAVTGSDTSANALFSSLQHSVAQANPALAGASPDLFLAANTMGGVVGKMISPQSLAIAALATGEHESTLFRKILPWSLAFLAVLCALVFLQSGVLAAMVP